MSKSDTTISNIANYKITMFRLEVPNREPRISELAIMISDVHPRYRSDVAQNIIEAFRHT